MGARDSEQAVESWRAAIDFYDDFRGDADYWPHAGRMQGLIECVLASPVGKRYFASLSMTCLGISRYATWEERQLARVLWINQRTENGQGGFTFELRDHSGKQPVETWAFVREEDGFAMLTEWLAKLDAEPGA